MKIFAVDAIASENSIASGNKVNPGQFFIKLNAPTTKNIRIKFRILGTATKGKDYNIFEKSILILAGNVSRIIDIDPIDDYKQEGTEMVTLKLIPDKFNHYFVRSPNIATVKIRDND